VTVTKTVLTIVMKSTAVRQQLSTRSDMLASTLYSTYQVVHHWLNDDE